MRKLSFLVAVFMGISVVYAEGESLYVIFPANSSDLTVVDSRQAIANAQTFTRVAQLLVENPHYRLLVDGHANPVIRTAAEERATLRPLSLRRAEAAAAFLVQYYNVDANRLIISGAGGGFPAGTGRDPSLNRRVSFVIVQNR